MAGEDGGYNEKLIGMLKTCLMGCDYIGCRRLIIHPFFLGYNDQLTPEREWEVNLERYSALSAAAKANRLCEMCGAPTNGIRGYLCAECAKENRRRKQAKADAKRRKK